MSLIPPMVSSIFNSPRAIARIASPEEEKPITLKIRATLEADEITSNSAVIHIAGSGIDLNKIGKGNVLVIVMLVEGRSGKLKLSATSLHTVIRSHFNFTELLSNETLRDENHKPLDLLPDTKYKVTLGYRVVKAEKSTHLDSIYVITSTFFKTAPEKAEKNDTI